jgi:hypothetical protein
VSSRGRILIYDYEEGYVIDATTGEVVDRIYDYSPTGICPGGCGDTRRPRRNNQVTPPASHEYYRNRRLYEKVRRLEDSGFVVDYNRLFSVGFKRVLQKQSSIRVEGVFRERGLLPELEGILREIELKAPHVLARSRRSLLVIAYAIRELRAGRVPSYSKSPVRGLVREGLFRRALGIALRLYKELDNNGGGAVAEVPGHS